MQILLMDDEEQVRRVTARMLEMLGHEVTPVADGNQALE
jgi:CheY-like chemotaxis protein